MAANPQATHTVEEYLAFERASDTKHEYYAGQIVAMAGASYAQLRGSDCSVAIVNLRLGVSPSGPPTYPDVTVVCGQPHFTDERPDTIELSSIGCTLTLADVYERVTFGAPEESSQ